ncbi:DUF2066 domain-containing protein [Thalassomonas actiniarum]|uniref:DUF2066 domain-containing protein n=1 Tax=Thalassomonas actiniarum TaxID=485447 RepID=A0AAE9YL89_9GAMM|nr:DUF2066 domain-containing protein [Thalassomonas actiniarum]WDD97287.1 DUF2066 domain-containing protein [Thalassomonas actiniarum]
MTFLCSAALHAVEVKDLYQAKVPVNSQAKAERNRALKQALRSVIVKVSGQEAAVDNDVVKQAVANHQQYLSQYTYERLAAYSTKNDPVKNKLVLQATFDEHKINALFQQAQLSLWGNLRPQVLLWLIEEQGLSRSILSSSSRSPLPGIATDYARQRGLPVIMPLMDLTDASQVRISDIWGRFAEPVRAASSRYYPEAIVVIRVSNSSLLPQIPQSDDEQDCILCQENNLVLDWSLLTDKQVFGQRRQSNNAGQLIEQALAEITQTIYQGYAQSPSMDNELLLDVANVDSLQTYMAVSQFLEKLSSVQSVRLVSARGTNRRFSLSLLGGKQALLASLKLNKLLQQHIDPLAEVRPDDVPVFYWGKS